MTSVEAAQQLREYLRDRIAQATEVDPRDLAKDAWEKFSTDAAWVAALVNERIISWLTEEVRDLLANTRTTNPVDWNDQLVAIGEKFERRSSIKQRAANRTMFLKWKEHIAPNQYVNLMDMDKDQCRAAVQLRRDQANTSLVRATFIEQLASGLTRNQKVKDAYSTEQLAKLWEAVTSQHAAAV